MGKNRSSRRPKVNLSSVCSGLRFSGLLGLVVVIGMVIAACSDLGGVSTATVAPPVTEPTQNPTQAHTSTVAPTATSVTEDLEPLTDSEEIYVDIIMQRDNWKTDFLRRTISYETVFSGGVPRDGIPSIDSPLFATVENAPDYLVPDEPVVALNIDGSAKAYSLNILTRHEIVNDELAGRKITVTYCPLCNSSIVFDRVVEGQELTFGVSGFLRNSDLIMYDRQTESWWQQFTGKGIAGRFAQPQVVLNVLPSTVISWQAFAEKYPDGQVLLRDPQYFEPNYSRPFYAGYDSRTSARPFLFRGELDSRLGPTERVLAVQINDESKAYSWDYLKMKGVVQDVVGNEPIVAFYSSSTLSNFRDLRGAAVVSGSAAAYSPIVNGETLTFMPTDDTFQDEQTNSTWTASGVAIAGELAGTRLQAVPQGNHFWFAWYAFLPDAVLVTSDAN